MSEKQRKPGLVQCDQCETVIPVPFPAGVIILMEVPDRPMRTPIAEWQTFHFHNIEELQAWALDAEQYIEPEPVSPPRIPYRRPRAASNA